MSILNYEPKNIWGSIVKLSDTQGLTVTRKPITSGTGTETPLQLGTDSLNIVQTGNTILDSDGEALDLSGLGSTWVGWPTEIVSGTTYTVDPANGSREVILTSSSDVTVSVDISATPSGSFVTGLRMVGGGTFTISPTAGSWRFSYASLEGPHVNFAGIMVLYADSKWALCIY